MIDIIGLIKVDESQPERINYLIASMRSYAFLAGHCTFTLALETPSDELFFKISLETKRINPDWHVIKMDADKSYGKRYIEIIEKYGRCEHILNFMEDQFMLLDDVDTLNNIQITMAKYEVDICKSSFFTIEQNSSRGMNYLYDTPSCRVYLNDSVNHFHNQKRYGKRFFIGVNFITSYTFARRFWNRDLGMRPHEYEIGSYTPEWQHICMLPKIEIQAAINDDHGEVASCMIKRSEPKWLKIWSEVGTSTPVAFAPQEKETVSEFKSEPITLDVPKSQPQNTAKRITLDANDFEKLVSGKIANKDGVDLILQDLGFDWMIKVIESNVNSQ